MTKTKRQLELQQIVYEDCLSTLSQYLDESQYDGKTFTAEDLTADSIQSHKGILAIQFYLVSRMSYPHISVPELIEVEMKNHGWIRRQDEQNGTISYTKPSQKSDLIYN